MTIKIPLSDILDQIALQLIEADSRAKERGRAIMSFEECEVEFDIAVEAHGNAGIKIYVVDIGADAKKTDTNKIKIKFKSLPSVPIQAEQRTGNSGPEIDRSNRK